VSQAAGEHRSSQSLEVGRTRELGVDGFELARGPQQELRRVAAALGRQRDLRAKQMHARALGVFCRAGFRGPK
jgi:hypothetical protein